QFFYAGSAHLGCIIPPKARKTDDDWGAYFTPDHRLPKDAWLHLGGFRGWLMTVNHKHHFIDFDDSKSFERLIKQFAKKEHSHLELTRYEEDSLTLHTNARRGWLMYLRHRGDSGLYTHDKVYAGDPESEEFFVCACGIEMEF